MFSGLARMAAEKMKEFGTRKLLKLYKDVDIKTLVENYAHQLEMFPFKEDVDEMMDQQTAEKMWKSTEIPVFNFRDEIHNSIKIDYMNNPCQGEECNGYGKSTAIAFLIITFGYNNFLRPGLTVCHKSQDTVTI